MPIGLRRFHIGGLILALLATIGVAVLVWEGWPRPVTLAVIAPLSGPDQASGRDMARAVQMRVDQANAAGGVAGRPVELVVEDDAGDPARARAIALRLAEEGRVAFALGPHTQASTMTPGVAPRGALGEIAPTGSLPMITASADLDGAAPNDGWTFRIGADDAEQAELIVSYIAEEMKGPRITLIHGDDASSAGLVDKLAGAAQAMEMTVTGVWSFDDHAPDVERRLDGIVNEVLALDDPGVVVVDAPSTRAADIVASLKNARPELSIFGTQALGAPSFQEALARHPIERLRPGSLSQGVHIASTFLPLIGPQSAQTFRQTFRDRWGDEPSWVAAGYHDAATLALAGMAAALKSRPGVGVGDLRRGARDWLAERKTAEDGVAGLEDSLVFDGDGVMRMVMKVATYAGGRLVSPTVQLEPAESTPAMAAGRLLKVGNRVMRLTDIVYTGLDINELSELNLRQFTFLADFYVWFRFRGQFDDRNIVFPDAVGPVNLGSPVVEEAVGDLTVRAYRVRARFRAPFEFKDFPFDQQTLAIRLRHATLARDWVILAPDVLGMRGSGPTDSQYAQPVRPDVADSIKNWKVAGAVAGQMTFSTDATLGIPSRFINNKAIDYSIFNYSVTIKRQVEGFLSKDLFVLFILVVLGALVHMAPAGEFNGRMAASTFTILTVTVFRNSLAKELPEISYLISIEYCVFVIYALALLALALSIPAYHAAKGGRLETVAALRWSGLTIHFLVVIVTIATYVMVYT